MKFSLLTLFPPVAAMLACAVLTARAQSPAGDAKPPVHKPDQSALNRLKQDDRTKKALEETVAKLREAARRQDAAEKEVKRLTAKDIKDDPKKAAELLKEKLSPEATAALKEAMERAKEVMETEDAKKLLQEAKDKAAAAAKSKTAPTTPPSKFGPSTFDQVPAPVPVTPQSGPLKRGDPNFEATADSIIFPPTQDPENPERKLPASDLRSRTYLLMGNAQVKTPNMVLEADRIEMLASQEGGGAGLGSLSGPAPPPKPAKGKAIDPVKPGINADPDEKSGDSRFERVIANGRVNILRIDDGNVQSGKGGSMIYEKKSGEMILTDWPEAQDGKNIVVGVAKDARIILVPNGKTRFDKCTVRDLKEAKASKSTAASTAPPKAIPVQ